MEKLRISPNPSENVTTEDCINHVIEILSDFKHESEKGIIGTENSIFYELKQFNTF